MKSRKRTASDNMNDIMSYNNAQFGSIRTLSINNEPWFIGKDVATALGYTDTNQAIRKHVDTEDKLTRRIDGIGQSRNTILINESGLYSLIFSSTLPSAKAFKHWVTSEVLPSIRKHGGYGAPVATPDMLAAMDERMVEQGRIISDMLRDLEIEIRMIADWI